MCTFEPDLIEINLSYAIKQTKRIIGERTNSKNSVFRATYKAMETSLVSDFDALRQCQDILTDGTAEIGNRLKTRMLLLYWFDYPKCSFNCRVSSISANDDKQPAAITGHGD